MGFHCLKGTHLSSHLLARSQHTFQEQTHQGSDRNNCPLPLTHSFNTAHSGHSRKQQDVTVCLKIRGWNLCCIEAQENFSCDFSKEKVSSGFSPALAQAVLGWQFSRGGTLANGSNDEKRKNKDSGCGWSRGHMEVGRAALFQDKHPCFSSWK